MDASDPAAAANGATDAWAAATRAADAAGVRLGPLTALDDCDRVNRVVEAVWGAQELQRELVRAMQLAGCVLIGATADDSDDLVGFVWGFAGWSDGPHLHSHMLATVPALQSRGVGFALKLAQRAAALDAGLDEIRWTYDPLLARNAWFNLMKLGAAGAAFLPEFYGEMTDQLNAGDRSDRFEVRWVPAVGPGDRGGRGVAGPRARGWGAAAGGGRRPRESRPHRDRPDARPRFHGVDSRRLPAPSAARPGARGALARRDGARVSVVLRRRARRGRRVAHGVYRFEMVKEPDDHG